MVNEIQYTSIKRVLDNLLDHPLLRDLTLEQAIRHTIRFISLHGYPTLYCDKIVDIDIEDFRGLLPCDLISIIQVKDLHSGICLRSMTDTFTPGMDEHRHHPHKAGKVNNATGEVFNPRNEYIPPMIKHFEELTFKTQGRVIFTSFPHGKINVAYRAIPVDEDGFPLLIDNETYLAALEAYIKKQVFTVKFDTGKIQAPVLQNAQKDYAMLAGELKAEMTTPSVSEMQSLTNLYTSLIPRMSEFYNGFKTLGDREYIRKH